MPHGIPTIGDTGMAVLLGVVPAGDRPAGGRLTMGLLPTARQEQPETLPLLQVQKVQAPPAMIRLWVEHRFPNHPIC